ncbi:type I-E CRISPR-associated protein Cse2/CasB [Brenneria izbisi]|uniref:Type I-E CRISPR-associated protein Cse2/CasB n=1 Tax=Brenneria izbisi TaxID=2939450 RepID=A0AA41XYP9_9GAMM|nr:type I-E CRISPR-associated protein Cse2/CasB [Brenneria izbisi]MCV9879675.1 type I-E CRISPR-associated protein Cse2/CasB [Brenneria izbisi]MCV9883131.1 type I-E CRISPR-associated protein Cse2/CasB [Brenneria izbisi]
MANTADLLVIDNDEANRINRWFAELQNRHNPAYNGRARRAQLRRANGPYGVLIYEGYHDLAARLSRQLTNETRILALSIFVSVAAHAAKNTASPPGDKRSFAAQLGMKTKGSDRPYLSPLRFERLQRAATPEALYRQLLRAVKIRGEDGVNLPSLADGIFLWADEWQARQENRAPIHPLRRNAVRWACEYAQVSQDPAIEDQTHTVAPSDKE